jgi:hypothetical protein
MQLDRVWIGGIVVAPRIVGYNFGCMVCADEHRVASEARKVQ